MTSFFGSSAALLAALLLSVGGLVAAEPSFPGASSGTPLGTDAWGVEHGLPQGTVEALAQDSQGFVWVGTQNGLVRFDGANFTRIDGGGGFWVRRLLADAKGRVWVGTSKGLGLFENGALGMLPLPDGEMDISGLVASPAGDVFVTERRRGLYRLTAHGELEHLHAIAGNATTLHLDSGGTLWVGGTGRIQRVRGESVVEQRLPDGMEDAIVVEFAEYQGRLLAATSSGVLALGRDGWARHALDPAVDGQVVTSLRPDSDGVLWVAGAQRVGRLVPGHGLQWIEDATAPYRPRQLMLDRDGVLWVGTALNGLARVGQDGGRIYGTAAGLAEPVVWAVAAGDDGSLFAGTDDGVVRFVDGRFEPVVPGSSFPMPFVSALATEGETLWIGTQMGLFRFHAGRLERIGQAEGMDEVFVPGILVARDGDTWIATSSGLFRRVEDQVRRIPADAERFRIVFEAADGTVLAGATQGLFRFDGEAMARIEEPGLPQRADVTAIIELAPGELLIATVEDGILMRRDGRWHRLSRPGGLPAERITGVFRNTEGELWFATLSGLFRVGQRELEAVLAGEDARLGNELMRAHPGRGSGRGPNCCNGSGTSTGWMGPGDVLWLPTSQGLMAVETRRYASQPGRAVPLIEAVRADEQRWPVRPGEVIRPDHGQRDLSFDFTALWLREPHAVHVQYRLADFESQWRSQRDRSHTTVDYVNLPPGRYRFEVRAAVGTGPWSNEVAGVDIDIPPHFRETGVFRLLLAALALGAVMALFQHQRQRHRNQRRLLEAVVRERTEALAASHRLLAETSHIEPGTGVRNQRYLRNQLPSDLAHYERENFQLRASGLLLAMVDLDPRLFTDPGRVLDRLSVGIRRCDYIVRWDERHCLVVSRPLVRSHVETFADRVHRVLCEVRCAAAIEVDALPSVGLALHPLAEEKRGSIGWEGSVEIARQALGWVREQGGGWAVFLPRRGNDQAGLSLALQLGVAQAIADGRVEVLRPSPASDEPEMDWGQVE